MFTDTATSIGRAENRPSPNQLVTNYDYKDNRIFEGIVVGVGPLQNLEYTCLVRVIGINETFKVEMSIGNSVSSSTSTGEFTPYFKGDRVLCRFLNGQQRMTIIGRINNTTGLSQYLQETLNIPTHGELNKSNERMEPGVVALVASVGSFDHLIAYPQIDGSNIPKPGAINTYPLDGSYISYVPNNIVTTSTSNIQLTSPVPIPKLEADIADTLRKLAVIKLVQEQSTVDPVYAWVDNPIAEIDEVLLQDQYEKQLEELKTLQSKLDLAKTKQACLDRQAKAIQDKAKLTYSTLTTELINIAVDEINSYLPSQFQFNASVVQTDGGLELTGLSLGDLSFDTVANTLTYKGDVFGSYISEGLSAVNGLLPDFLQIQLDTSKLSLGGTSINLDTLETNLGTKYDLGNSVSVKGQGESVIVSVGSQDYNVGSFASIRVNPLGKGLSSLNRQLPPELQTSFSFNSDLTPVMQMGFLSFDTSTGNLGFDANMAANAITSRVDQNVFSKLPAPIARLGRAAWRHLDLPGLLGSKPVVPSPNSSIITKIDCEGTQSVATPSLNFPAKNSTTETIQDTIPNGGNA